MSSLRPSLSNFFQEVFLPTQGGFNPGPAPANSTELSNRPSTLPCQVPAREKFESFFNKAVASFLELVTGSELVSDGGYTAR
jgi:hypothetical protein